MNVLNAKVPKTAVAITTTDGSEDFQDFDATNWLGLAVNLLSGGNVVGMLASSRSLHQV
jgi:hypothetical protein